MKKKLLGTITLFRALAPQEHSLICGSLVGDVISECYSRLMKSSRLRPLPSGNPPLRCLTDDFLTAYSYSQKSEYSGQIAAFDLLIYDDGSYAIDGCDDNGVFLHRLYKIADWIDLSVLSNRATIVHNLNYASCDVNIVSALSYGGQNAARGYAFAGRVWTIHADKVIPYPHIFTASEVNEFLNKMQHRRRYRCEINKLVDQISYNRLEDSSVNILIDQLITTIKTDTAYDETKSWARNTVAELEKLQHVKDIVL